VGVAPDRGQAAWLNTSSSSGARSCWRAIFFGVCFAFAAAILRDTVPPGDEARARAPEPPGDRAAVPWIITVSLWASTS